MGKWMHSERPRVNHKRKTVARSTPSNKGTAISKVWLCCAEKKGESELQRNETRTASGRNTRFQAGGKKAGRVVPLSLGRREGVATMRRVRLRRGPRKRER